MTAHTARARTVYFIRPIGMQGPIKIGCSFSPDRRRSSLETWSPFPLEIIAELPGCMDVERRLHSFLRHHHRSREWFDWTPQLQAIIDAVVTATFDPATLPEPVAFNRSAKLRDVAVFRDPAWRFVRSVDSRLRGARDRGASRAEIAELLGADPWDFMRQLKHAGDDRPHFEKLAVSALDALDQRYPRRGRKPLRRLAA